MMTFLFKEIYKLIKVFSNILYWAVPALIFVVGLYMVYKGDTAPLDILPNLRAK